MGLIHGPVTSGTAKGTARVRLGLILGLAWAPKIYQVCGCALIEGRYQNCPGKKRAKEIIHESKYNPDEGPTPFYVPGLVFTVGTRVSNTR